MKQKNHPKREKQQWKRRRTTTKIELISVGERKKKKEAREIETETERKSINIRVKERDPRVFLQVGLVIGSDRLRKGQLMTVLPLIFFVCFFPVTRFSKVA